MDTWKANANLINQSDHRKNALVKYHFSVISVKLALTEMPGKHNGNNDKI